MKFSHTPVLLTEAIDYLEVEQGKKYIDATVGGGGHFVEIVRRGGRVLGIDADVDAIVAAKERIRVELPEAKQGRDWVLVKDNFRNMSAIAKAHGFEGVDGILMDLGVSSYQLDTPERGFSYRFADGPLDMRLDRESETSARTVVSSASESELYEILAKFGEEERAGIIAHALVRARSIKPIQTTGDLAAVVESVAGTGSERVLSRVFQALRIATNDELTALREALEGSAQILKVGGILVVISFHSLEDRIVKIAMRTDYWKEMTKHPIISGQQERLINKRARSAKMRVAQKT